MRGHNTPRCRIVKENPRWALESVEEPLTNYAHSLPLWDFGLPRREGSPETFGPGWAPAHCVRSCCNIAMSLIGGF